MIKRKMTPEGLVLYNVEKHTTLRLSPSETEILFKQSVSDDYPSPEIVHLEIGTSCNLSCRYCYVDKTRLGLRTDQWKAIIKDLADSGIFQITFGGGEPTLRPDLIDLAQYARSCGLNLTMTTNGTVLDRFGDSLRAFNQINVSIHRPNPLSVPSKALNYLAKLGIPRGINFCFSEEYRPLAAQVMILAKETGASVLFLAYKPVVGDYENQVPIQDIMAFAEEHKNDGVTIGVDGMTCGKCFGSKRFCDIDCDGNMLPCSFVREPVGNLLTEKFEEVWKKRPRELKCPYLNKQEAK